MLQNMDRSGRSESPGHHMRWSRAFSRSGDSRTLGKQSKFASMGKTVETNTISAPTGVDTSNQQRTGF